MHQNYSNRLSLSDLKNQLNRFEILESMHLLAPAGEVVLTPGVALCLELPPLAKIIFPVLTPYDLN
jgi:hypothetical protein